MGSVFVKLEHFVTSVPFSSDGANKTLSKTFQRPTMGLSYGLQ